MAQKKWAETSKVILDWLLPPRCVVTGNPVDHQGMVSANIWRSLNFITSPFCQSCGIPFAYVEDGGSEGYCGGCLKKPPQYDGARAALVYDDASRPLVLGFKHGDKTYTADTFAAWMIQAIGGKDGMDKNGVIVPVPLHYKRLLKRRYNQAGLLAASIAKRTEIAYYPRAMKRVRSTPTQGGKNWKEKQDNVRNAIEINPEYRTHLRDRAVYLVDDVLTTGATVNACASVLRRTGVKSITVLSLARVVRPDML